MDNERDAIDRGSLEQQIDDARAACNAYYVEYYDLPDKNTDCWKHCNPSEQNAWHRVVEVVRERKGE